MVVEKGPRPRKAGTEPRKRPAVRQLPPDTSAKPLGKNARHKAEQAIHNSGPDLPSGLALDWLPKPDEVPPKPKGEPDIEYPGTGHSRLGHGEWCLFSEFDPAELGLVVSREWRARWVPPDEKRCVARAVGKTNNWMGNRCTRPRLKGARVCRYHGGALPNVKKAAQAALATAALPAAEKLIHIALKKGGVSDADRIKAIIQILDRAGVEGKTTIEIELPLWQKTLQGIYADVAPEGSEIPGRELEEGVDYILDDDEDEDDGED